MSAEDLENYETDAQMALYREYKDVMSLFSYAVETDRRFYLANQVDVTPHVQDGTLYFEVSMSDVWVWDVFRSNRFVKKVHAYSVRDVNVEERLPNQELTPSSRLIDRLAGGKRAAAELPGGRAGC